MCAVFNIIKLEMMWIQDVDVVNTPSLIFLQGDKDNWMIKIEINHLTII